MALVPGYLCLKLSRWPARSALQFLVYAFALSLLINYCLVCAMVSRRVQCVDLHIQKHDEMFASARYFGRPSSEKEGVV